MLPVGHIAHTWAAVAWLQSHHLAENTDLRSAALASLLPDLVDKPKALAILAHSGTSQGPGHSLFGQAMLILAAAALERPWLRYALISGSHLVADQMWKYQRTLMFPFSGRLDT